MATHWLFFSNMKRKKSSLELERTVKKQKVDHQKEADDLLEALKSPHFFSLKKTKFWAHGTDWHAIAMEMCRKGYQLEENLDFLKPYLETNGISWFFPSK